MDKNTMVQDEAGYKKVSELKPGDKVFGYYGLTDDTITAVTIKNVYNYFPERRKNNA